MVPILLGVSLLTFLADARSRREIITPSLRTTRKITPAKLAELEAKQHLDKPWFVRYGFWLNDAAQWRIWVIPTFYMIPGK